MKNKRTRQVANITGENDCNSNKIIVSNKSICVANKKWMNCNLSVLDQINNGVYGTVFNVDICYVNEHESKTNYDSFYNYFYTKNQKSENCVIKSTNNKNKLCFNFNSYDSKSNYVVKYIDFMSFLKAALLQEFQKHKTQSNRSISKYFSDYLKSLRNEIMVKKYCDLTHGISDYVVEPKDIFFMSSAVEKNIDLLHMKQTFDTVSTDSVLRIINQKYEESKKSIQNCDNFVTMCSEDVFSDYDHQIDFYKNYNTVKHQQRVIQDWENHKNNAIEFFKCNEQSFNLSKMFIIMQKMEKTMWQKLIEVSSSNSNMDHSDLSIDKKKQTDSKEDEQINIFQSIILCWIKLIIDFNFVHCDFHMKNIMIIEKPSTIVVRSQDGVEIKKSFHFTVKAIDFSQVITPLFDKDWETVSEDMKKKITTQLSNFQKIINEYFRKKKHSRNKSILNHPFGSENFCEINITNMNSIEQVKTSLVHHFSKIIK